MWKRRVICSNEMAAALFGKPETIITNNNTPPLASTLLLVHLHGDDQKVQSAQHAGVLIMTLHLNMCMYIMNGVN